MTREAPTKEGSVVAPAQELNRPLSIGVQPSTSSFCVSQIIRSGRPLQSSLRADMMARTRSRGPRRNRVRMESGDAALMANFLRCLRGSVSGTLPASAAA